MRAALGRRHIFFDVFLQFLKKLYNTFDLLDFEFKGTLTENARDSPAWQEGLEFILSLVAEKTNKSLCCFLINHAFSFATI